MEKRKTLALTAGLLTLATLVAAQTERQGQVADAFAQRCAACHGAELQGGQAKSLLDDEWKYGGDDASLAASIRDGHPTDGMPPFAAMLDDQAVRAMVIFIRERADSARRSKTTFAKPLGDTVVT
ncbi:MAG TPA: c-type cytochrome, partial [Vicinamibacteria bacterium]